MFMSDGHGLCIYAIGLSVSFVLVDILMNSFFCCPMTSCRADFDRAPVVCTFDPCNVLVLRCVQTERSGEIWNGMMQ